MKTRNLKRVISLLLCMAMTFTFMYAPVGAAYADESTSEPLRSTTSEWTLLNGIEEAAASEVPVAITMTKGTSIWILPTAKVTSGPPAAQTASISGSTLTANGEKNAYGWSIAGTDGTYTITNSDGLYLCVDIDSANNANNAVRISSSTKPSAGADWTITSNYLTTKDSKNATRYLGVYNNQDWRAYTSINSNITGQTLQFWAFSSESGEAETPSAYWEKVDEELVTGAKVVIYHPESGMVLTETASGKKLLGAAGTITDDGLGILSAMVQLDVTVTDGKYTFANAEGKFLASGSTGSELKFVDAESDLTKWTPAQQADGTWTLTNVGADYNNSGTYNQALEYYSGFTTFGLTDVTDAYKFEFYGTNEAVEPPQGPFTVTITQAEHGTITASKTENVSYNEEITITMTPDEGYVADKLFVNGAAFNPAATDGVVTVKITRDTTVTGEFKADTPAPTYSTIAEALAGAANTQFTVKGVVTLVDGKNIYIQDETGGIDLYFDTAPTGISLGDTLIGTGKRATYKGLPELSGATYEMSEGMTLTATERTIGTLTDADICTYVSLKGLKVTAVDDNGGAFTQPNITVVDPDDSTKTIQIYKAVVGKTTEGEWEVKVDDTIDVTCALGTFNGYQLRNTLASEIKVKGEKEGLVTDLADLETGDYVVIYNPDSSLAMNSETYRDWYLMTSTVTIEEDKVVDPADNLVWQVTVNEDGTYTFTQDNNLAVAGWVSTSNGNTYPELTSNAAQSDADLSWMLTSANAENNTYYMESKTLSTSKGKLYIEVFNKNVNGTQTPVFCTYGAAASSLTEGPYGMQLYHVKKSAPQPPTGDTFGLTSTLNTGDQVIIYNPKSGKALGNTLSGYNMAAVSLTPSEGVITTDNTAVVWTVTKNSDGTYEFKQGDKTLGGVVSGSYNNLVPTDATATKWTLEGPDASDFNYFMYLGDMTSTYGKVYFEYYNGFTLRGTNTPDKDAYGINFYKKGADPEVPSGGSGNLITNLSQLEDGVTVAIYNQKHFTAISNKPNGDWYLKANPVTVLNSQVTQFTEDCAWTVKKNSDGTYTFYAYGDENRSIAVWPSTVGENTFAEVTVDSVTYPDNKWTLTPASTANSFYFTSATVTHDNKPAYLSAYTNYGIECYRGTFTTTISENNMALQFYLINPEDATPPFDDGTWDKVLTPGEQYVIYNETADAVLGLFKEANYAYDAIPTEFTGTDPNLAIPGNGAYAFTVGNTGRYYTFKIGDKYMASNDEEELYLEELKDGQVPDNAKWFLWKNGTGYVIYNKEANYKGSNVCIEYFSSVFSGWTYKNKTKDIFLFNFYKVSEDSFIHENVVQAPSVLFDCEDSRYIEQDYPVTITLDDLADEITDIEITFTAGSKTGTITDYEVSSDGKNYTFTIPASEIDVEEGLESFELNVNVVNSYGIEYEGSKTVAIVDEPFFEDLTPAPNSQTRDDKRPVVSARVGNVGEEPTFTLKLNDEVITDFVYENGILSYTPTEDMEDGRVNVLMTVTRKDGVSAEKSWNFTVGISDYQLYFGQLHSHTTYSDGSGTLDTALDYIGSLPESANVQFVAFTDHSNYFDAPNAANPADALNDKSLMTAGSLADWNTYKETIAAFNAKQSDVIAIGGFEMTWSGGPGHINTYDSDGLVSRNNALLNNKTNDAGMKLYYETINKGESLNQFNHPGTTFGNFTDFSYWNEETDAHMFLVEVGNGEGQIGAGGYYPSYEQYTLALDQGWHLAPTNNQDNHKGRWGNANDARDVILTNDFSEEGIYNAIRDLRVYATEDKNLQISYTMNDEPMGTIFTEENTPETLNTVITVYDPNNYDGTAKVELVANGGVVAKTWDSAEELAEGLFTAELTPEYGYYFVRVTQEDGDIAVTAPIWTGLDVAVGIKEVNVATEQPLVNQPMTINTTLFNNEEDAVNVKSLTYTVDGSTVIGTDTDGHPIAAGDEITVPFEYTPTVAKRMTVTVTAVFTVGDKEVTYSKDVTFSVRENDGDLPVTDIDVVNSQTEAGYEYAIEGVVTSNASGYDKDTAFFDCIYVQDATGGICCFPVSGEYKIGDKVHIEGYTDFYQGEPELQVESIEVIGTGTVEPTEVTAAQINDLSVLGSLVTIKGTVDSVEEANGLIQTIMVRDANGDVARVFIDGYITTANEVENCVVGADITATGISSYDDTFNAPEGPFPRIRIRNRADIVCTAGEPEAPHLRVMGSSRYDTAFQAANYMKTVKGIDQFDTVVVAYGVDFADALSGSYLAAVAEAPILLVHPKYEGDVLEYIGHNVKPEGKVYLLGGTSVVSEAFEQQLKNASFDVKRLGGANRFETNILILEEGNALGGDASEVLVASATGFADALSTSSVGKPILLAGAKLTADQQDYLREAQPKNAWIVGGTSAVNATVEADLKNFVADGGIKRPEGGNRYETSYMVAHEFFPGECETAILVYGQNFPDGLSGGAVASVIGAPVLLAMDRDDMIANVAKWVQESGATKSVTFGGPTLVTDNNVRTIMADPEAEIVLFE